MADIKYLAGLDIDGNINLNKNSLNNIAIQALASNPASPVTAQIYYNTSNNELRIYTGSSWIAVGADTDNYVDGGSYSAGTLTLTRTGSLADINITGLLQLGTTSTTALAGDTVIPAAANNGVLTIATAGIASGGGTFTADQSSNNTITITATEADTLATVTARGASTSTAVTFGAVSMLGDLNMNSGKIVNLADPTTAQGAATRNYVDQKVTGQLIYQGGYDASAAPPTGSTVLKGFTYTVTVAGDGNGFFTTELEIGDLIIAESDNPTTEADWTEVNKNVDLATTTTVGVASFSSSNFAVSAAGEVTVKNNGIALGTETTGNYVATVSGGTNVTVSGGTGEGSTPTVSVANSSIDNRITNRQYAGLIGGATSVTIAAGTHGLGSDSSQFMIQLVEVSSGETVHAEVTRGASGAVTIGFTTAPSANAIRVLINKIG